MARNIWRGQTRNGFPVIYADPDHYKPTPQAGGFGGLDEFHAMQSAPSLARPVSGDMMDKLSWRDRQPAQAPITHDFLNEMVDKHEGTGGLSSAQADDWRNKITQSRIAGGNPVYLHQMMQDSMVPKAPTSGVFPGPPSKFGTGVVTFGGERITMPGQQPFAIPPGAPRSAASGHVNWGDAPAPAVAPVTPITPAPIAKSSVPYDPANPQPWRDAHGSGDVTKINGQDFSPGSPMFNQVAKASGYTSPSTQPPAVVAPAAPQAPDDKPITPQPVVSRAYGGPVDAGQPFIGNDGGDGSQAQPFVSPVPGLVIPASAPGQPGPTTEGFVPATDSPPMPDTPVQPLPVHYGDPSIRLLRGPAAPAWGVTKITAPTGWPEPVEGVPEFRLSDGTTAEQFARNNRNAARGDDQARGLQAQHYAEINAHHKAVQQWQEANAKAAHEAEIEKGRNDRADLSDKRARDLAEESKKFQLEQQKRSQDFQGDWKDRAALAKRDAEEAKKQAELDAIKYDERAHAEGLAKKMELGKWTKDEVDQVMSMKGEHGRIFREAEINRIERTHAAHEAATKPDSKPVQVHNFGTLAEPDWRQFNHETRQWHKAQLNDGGPAGGGQPSSQAAPATAKSQLDAFKKRVGQ